MRLAINQPYFFPYRGYFDLINQADLFVAFDTAQYVRHSWMNRNKITTGYITVPLQKHSQKTPLNEIKISTPYKDDLINKLMVYNKSPQFVTVTNFIRSILHGENLSELNINTLRAVCEYLGITTPIVAYSNMSLKLGPINEPGDWAVEISKALGATEYLNLPGGKSFLDPKRFNKLTFIETKPSLSIIDDLYEGLVCW